MNYLTYFRSMFLLLIFGVNCILVCMMFRGLIQMLQSALALTNVLFLGIWLIWFLPVFSCLVVFLITITSICMLHSIMLCHVVPVYGNSTILCLPIQFVCDFISRRILDLAVSVLHFNSMKSLWDFFKESLRQDFFCKEQAKICMS